jgi:hypothetical protein
MDLLGGYDSDSDSSDEAIVGKAKSHQLKEPSKPKPKPNLRPPTTNSTNKKPNKRGKKLLKLQAVLPEHIWNQLSGGGGGADSDEGEESAIKMATKKSKPAPSESKSTISTEDTELSSLLRELPKSKKSGSLRVLGPSSILGDTTATFLGGRAGITNNDQLSKSKFSLGAAFLTSTVEVTRRTKNEDAKVRSVHEAETVESDEDDDASQLQTVGTTAPASSIPPPPLAPPRLSSIPRAAAPSLRSAAPTVAARPSAIQLRLLPLNTIQQLQL